MYGSIGVVRGRGCRHRRRRPLPQHEAPRRGSFLRLLKSSVTADDYVVVKVDIDGGPELAIVESIAHLPELSDLVDEMYFEYHFNFDNQPHPWGRGTFGGNLARSVQGRMDVWFSPCNLHILFCFASWF